MPYKDKEKQREAQRKWDRKNRVGKRHQVWTGIFYEESSPDWREELDELCLPVCVSPLHDRDVWTARDERKNSDHIEGEIKKAHRHFLVEYPSGVDYATVKEDFAFLSGGSHIKFVKSKAAMALYLVHAKNDDKAKYDPAEVLEFGGANWRDWCSELEDIHATMLEMRAFIVERNVTEFDLFQLWCDENNDTWSRALDLKCSWAIGNFIERRRNRIQQCAKLERERRRDNETDSEPGE